MILLPDPRASRLVWQLSYVDLSAEDANSLQGHFNACCGRYRAFTFIDPTDNMLASSSDLAGASWQISNSITITSGVADPNGGFNAFTLTNNGQVDQQLTQSLAVPANNQYCFSMYVSSLGAGEVMVTRQGLSASEQDRFSTSPNWNRIVASGRLNDSSSVLKVGVTLSPGQEISLYGPQVEGQIAPSGYRATTTAGGVYTNAHWAVDELVISATAPNLFATSFNIETGI